MFPCSKPKRHVSLSFTSIKQTDFCSSNIIESNEKRTDKMMSKALLKAVLLATTIATNPVSSFTTTHQSVRRLALHAQREGSNNRPTTEVSSFFENTKKAVQTGLPSAALILGTTFSPNIHIQNDNNTPFLAPPNRPRRLLQSGGCAKRIWPRL